MDPEEIKAHQFYGVQARDAWSGYFSNQNGRTLSWPVADGYAVLPDSVFVAAADAVAIGKTRLAKSTWHFAARNGIAIVAMTRGQDRTWNIIYVHSREKQKGVCERLVRTIMKELDVGWSLTVQPSIHMSWVSLLFFLSVGFFGDFKLQTVEVPYEWEGSLPTNAAVGLIWAKHALQDTIGAHARHMSYVMLLRDAKINSPTIRDKHFGIALDMLTEKLKKHARPVQAGLESEEEKEQRRVCRNVEMDAVRGAHQRALAIQASMLRVANRQRKLFGDSRPGPGIRKKAPAKMRASNR